MAATPHVRDAHNVTLPDGSAARPLNAGTLRLTETWIDRCRRPGSGLSHLAP